MRRNVRYPSLGDNPKGLCATCGSDCPNGECPRQCNEFGPVLTDRLQPMDPAWAAMSQELGTTLWIQSDWNMKVKVREALGRLSGPALVHLRCKMQNYGVTV